MSFDYDKVTAKSHEHASWWTSYADLFMMLSIVFLLMYVASSLRSGSAGFQQQLEYKKLAQRAQDLEEQIKVYNTLKDEALRKQSSDEEQQVYQKLMGKLNLLQDEAHEEKLALQRKAKENADKEFALNQYQQLIRNIINTNILAKTQIQHRDQLIVTKDATIEEKKHTIANLESTISQNQTEIQNIQSQLSEKITHLREEQQRHRTSKAMLEKRIAALRQDSENKIEQLENSNKNMDAELGQMKGALAQTEQKLGHANATIQQQEHEKSALENQLEGDRARYQAEMDGLKREHEAKMAAERAAFEKNLAHQRLSDQAKAKKLAEFMDREKQKASELQNQLSGLQGKINDTEGKLKTAQNELAGTKQQLSGAQQALQGTQNKLADAEAAKGRALAEVAGLQGDLAKTREIANARRKLAQQIADQFAKSGLKGAVDGGTGEVTLDFGEEYFDTGSTNLKPKMVTTLDKFIPIYAKSLFADKKIADKIGSVEIVGFASSTYKGHYVNPKSVRPEDKDAIEYNLKLSFGRANSIFKHVLNQSQLSQADRDRLLPIMKVVGRGYLPEGKSASDMPMDMTERAFCEKFNCKKAQKVIVKFNMKD